MKKHIPKIVITGGPCGGKSSAMPFLYERFIEAGYFPILVPEAPTILMNRGHSPRGGEAQLRAFQERVIDLILEQEEESHQHAMQIAQENPIIIYDRGIMDTKAYTGELLFNEIAKSRGLQVETLLLARYHAVFHMQSAAIGAEEYYTKENNAIRLENLDEARLAERRTLDAWSRHPKHIVIENQGKNFNQKLETLWSKITLYLAE
jgi:predicted ATPase